MGEKPPFSLENSFLQPRIERERERESVREERERDRGEGGRKRESVLICSLEMNFLPFQLETSLKRAKYSFKNSENRGKKLKILSDFWPF